MRQHRRGHYAATPPGRTGRAAAFAEGRRMRSAAQRQAQMRRFHRGATRRRRLRSVPLALLLMIAVPVLSGGFVVVLLVVLTLLALGAVTAAIAAAALPTLLVGGLTFAVVRRRNRRAALRRGGAPGTAPLPARPAARPDVVWAHARQRFHSLRAAYAAYECDAMAVLRLPALADVSVPSTARFVDAFAQAQALETDAFPPHAATFVRAVDLAERSWRAAREAAERIRLTGLSPAERATVERVIKLLTTARDSDSDPERLTAYALARSELAKLDTAGVIHVPLPAQAALQESARGALPA